MRKKWIYLTAIIVIVMVLSILAVIFINRGSNNYIATIAGEKVTVPEYKFFLNVVKGTLETEAGKDDTDFSKAEYWASSIDGKSTQDIARDFALEQVKEFKTLLIKAKEKNISLDKATSDSVDKYFDKQRSNFGSDADAKFIKEYGVTEDEARAIYKDGKLKDKFETEEKKSITASDAEVKDFFEKNKNSLEEVTVRHILFLTTDISGSTVTPLSKSEQKKAKTNAENIYNQIKSGKDMAALAKEYSQDLSSKDNGGLMAPFKRGDMPANIEEWAFNAKVGDLAIVKADYGYHVVRLEAKKDSFNDLKTEAKEACINQKYNDMKEAWFKDEKYNIVINHKVLDTILVVP